MCVCVCAPVRVRACAGVHELPVHHKPALYSQCVHAVAQLAPYSSHNLYGNLPSAPIAHQTAHCLHQACVIGTNP